MPRDLFRYRTELFLTFSSTYAAVQLLIFHHHFTEEPNRYRLLMHLENNEKFWTWFVTITAVLKLLGILLSFWRVLPRVSPYLRRVGLAGSAVFWTVLGLSYFLQFPYNVVSGPLVFMSGLSFWLLFKTPVNGYT